MINIEFECRVHPGYKGQRTPTASCRACKEMYELLKDLEATFVHEFEDGSSITIRKLTLT